MFNASVPVGGNTQDPVELLISSAAVMAEAEPEGQLAVDVFETENDITIIAAMAGTLPENIELHISGDVFTVRGIRQVPVQESGEFFYRECFWGRFSRTIVLPTDVKPELARATYKNGVLMVSLPKARAQSTIPIFVVES